MSYKIPKLLFAAYLIVFIALGIEPYSRGVWWAENIPILMIVAFLVATYRSFKFSNTSYILMSFLIFIHTVGGHYTFERVPFDVVTQFFGFERNHYDRMGHFSVGFYAYPIAEYLVARKLAKSWVIYVFPIFAIFTVASVYEIVEWLYAAYSDPQAGIAFLGSQGDVWDAQKDMLADGLGSIFAMAIFWWRNSE